MGWRAELQGAAVGGNAELGYQTLSICSSLSAGFASLR